jgi:hypothetical protein
MKRKALIVLLALGAVGGFVGGIASMRCHSRGRHAYFKEQVTQVCAEAMRRSASDAH